MNVTVVMPWRGGCPHRDLAMLWVRERYQALCPDWELRIAAAPPGPWVKATAVNPAVSEARSDLIVMADADVWCDQIVEAVEAVAAGAPWAIPHHTIRRLSRDATGLVLVGADPWSSELEQDGYLGVEGGGIVVAPRETLLGIPLDPRFVGWGQEDHAWGSALRCLAGTPWRGKAPLVHLWHPSQERLNRKWGSMEGKQLWFRYAACARHPDRMRALIQEAKDAAAAHQHAVPDQSQAAV